MESFSFYPTLQALFPIAHTHSACAVLTTSRTFLDGLRSFTYAKAIGTPNYRPELYQVSPGFAQTLIKILGIAPDVLALLEGYLCPFTELQYVDYKPKNSIYPFNAEKFELLACSSSGWVHLFPESSFRVIQSLKKLYSALAFFIRMSVVNFKEEEIRVTNRLYAQVSTQGAKSPETRYLLSNRFLNPSSINYEMNPFEIAMLGEHTEAANRLFLKTSLQTFVAACFIYLTHPKEESSFFKETLALRLMKRFDVLESFKDIAASGVLSSPVMQEGIQIHLLQIAVEKKFWRLLMTLLKKTEGMSEQEHRARLTRMLELTFNLDQYIPENLDKRRLKKLRPLFKGSKTFANLDQLTALASALLSHQMPPVKALVKAGTDLSCSRKPQPFPYGKLVVLDCYPDGLAYLFKNRKLCLLDPNDQPLNFHLTAAECTHEKNFLELIKHFEQESRFSLGNKDSHANTLYHHLANLIVRRLQSRKAIPNLFSWIYNALKENYPELACARNQTYQWPSEVFNELSIVGEPARAWKERFKANEQQCELKKAFKHDSSESGIILATDIDSAAFLKFSDESNTEDGLPTIEEQLEEIDQEIERLLKTT